MYQKKLIRTFKFRLYPSKTQQKIIQEQFETCCQVYNTLLDVKLNEGLSRFELQNETYVI
ncbi:MAG: helix-turn-helix domain-containing protein [Candidatus Nanoarchaeia archaeon]